MSDEHLDQVLADLEIAVESLRSDCAAVVSLADRLDDEVESLLERQAVEHPASTSATPRPRQTHLSLRLRLAEAAARQHREALCGLVAWWADAAVVTVMVTAQGRAKQRIQGVGLAVKPGPGGEPMLVEDVWPEPRRCRLWGAVWQEHRMPLLPSTAQLTEALTVRGVANETIDAIREASSAVETQLAAMQRFTELERQLNDGELSDDDEKAAEAEILATLDLTEKTGELLIAYARTLTQSLPTVRAAT
ncbi:hypothetical protein ETD83_14750 [Actinomadura soli]|uniref:Uncharacterized protein n=1 Tax=Actinomadura soli TaxID=2508997 RepID=A0A5C4JDB3_9ACTN|nr:hypothetical protein [Actinomadura soli]TMR01255.1 hypothetical protein ETD83_14750 [Actinomadura soli]